MRACAWLPSIRLMLYGLVALAFGGFAASARARPPAPTAPRLSSLHTTCVVSLPKTSHLPCFICILLAGCGR